MDEHLKVGDIVTLGESPTRWQVKREADGLVRLVNIGTPETQEEFSARARKALADSQAAQRARDGG